MSEEKQLLAYPLLTEKKWAASFLSLLRKAAASQNRQCSLFADPRQQEIARELLRHFPELKCYLWGGYPAAERVRICLSSSPLAGDEEKEVLSCLVLRGDFPADMLSHRDFLGALLGLGLKREMIGDIIYQGAEKVFVILARKLASFVRFNLKKAGSYPLEVEELPLDELRSSLAPRRVKEIRGTVASLRLDAVSGLGFGLSRSKIAPLIRGEQVKINHEVIKQPARAVQEGDLISLAGRGRIEIVEVGGKSRKGRTHLLVHRII
ncbi:MAG: RNA-binding protein [Firmicutes bacterium]|nr:RNA-binding protein [Bacillota bacterium]